VCLKWLKEKFLEVIGNVFIYTILHYLVFLTGLIHKNKIMKYIGTGMSSLSFIYRIWTSNGFSTVDHSKANVQICIFFFMVLIIITMWFFIMFKCFVRSTKSGSIFLGSWLLFWGVIYYARFARSCDHLQDSLVPEVKYSEEGGECHWIKGRICWHYTIDGIFTPLYWGRTKCDSFEDNL
jgi:hypothetical protein